MSPIRSPELLLPVGFLRSLWVELHRPPSLPRKRTCISVFPKRVNWEVDGPEQWVISRVIPGIDLSSAVTLGVHFWGMAHFPGF